MTNRKIALDTDFEDDNVHKSEQKKDFSSF
jgi:hypothetical protein